MAEEKKTKEPKTVDAAASVSAVTPSVAPAVAAVAAAGPVVKEEPKIKFVMMKRITDGDGPHPIHPDEVENYRRGDWVEA